MPNLRSDIRDFVKTIPRGPEVNPKLNDARVLLNCAVAQIDLIEEHWHAAMQEAHEATLALEKYRCKREDPYRVPESWLPPVSAVADEINTRFRIALDRALLSGLSTTFVQFLAIWIGIPNQLNWLPVFEAIDDLDFDQSADVLQWIVDGITPEVDALALAEIRDMERQPRRPVKPDPEMTRHSPKGLQPIPRQCDLCGRAFTGAFFDRCPECRKTSTQYSFIPRMKSDGI